MPFVGKANCQHLDNWGRCRVHTAHWSVRWMLPKGRPLCIFEFTPMPQDGQIECPDQKPWTPPPPGPVRSERSTIRKPVE